VTDETTDNQSETERRRLVATGGAAAELAARLALGPVARVTTAAEVLAAARSGAEAAVVGEYLADADARELCRQVRNLRVGSGLFVVVVAEAFSDAGETEALEAGADEYVDPERGGERLVRRLRSRLRSARRRQELNPLTGLPGRGRLDQERARRPAGALVALDLRRFKAFNDRYGYERGDEMLRAVAAALGETLEAEGRPEDFLAHLGGDDFFLLTDPERAEGLVAAMQARFTERARRLYAELGEEPEGEAVHLLAVGVRYGPGAATSAARLAQGKEKARQMANKGLIWER
jgi:diguanylate cyclase (GGDEF)-like protein